jgi:multidrug efflux pump subunit AcrA (membrane-fusion protein)
MKRAMCLGAISLLCVSFAFSQAAASGMPISVEAAKNVMLDNLIHVIGEIKSSDDVQLASQFGGRIIELDLQVGDTLEKNSIVARLRSGEAEILARKTGDSSNDIQIISPISGFVVEKFVSIGDMVSAGQPIARIVSPAHNYLLLNLASDYLGKVVPNDPVFFAAGGAQISAKVDYVVPVVDPATGTFQAIIELNRRDVFPGFFVEATIRIDQKMAIAVPRSAVLTVDGKKVVFVINKDIATMRDVVTGIETGDFIEVTTGMAIGELVAVKGNFELSDGTAVTIEKP